MIQLNHATEESRSISASGQILIFVDRHNGGAKTFKKLARQKEWPKTARATTHDDNDYIVYALPPDVRVKDGQLGPGIYIVEPGSIDGRPYWANELPVAEAPKWLIEVRDPIETATEQQAQAAEPVADAESASTHPTSADNGNRAQRSPDGAGEASQKTDSEADLAGTDAAIDTTEAINMVAPQAGIPLMITAAMKAGSSKPKVIKKPYASKLEAALDLAQSFAVFPLNPGSKTPFLKKWPELATMDVERIRKCWTENPNRNVAVQLDGYVVIDIDPRNGGDKSWEELAPTVELPTTSRVQTWSGGSHIIFALPKGVRLKSNKNVLGPGIDVKSGPGAYIVGAGSEIDGRHYKWVDAAPVAMAPQWLIERCQAARWERSASAGKRIVEEDETAVQMAQDWLDKYAPTAVLGEIDNTAFQVAAKFYDYGVSPATAEYLLAEWSETHADPPMEIGDIKRVASSAGRNRQNAIGARHPSASGFEPVEITGTLPTAEQLSKALGCETEVAAEMVEMNKKHCVIADMGGKCVIANETIDRVSGETKTTFSTVEAFKNRYSNRNKTVKVEGNDKNIPLAKWWLGHKQRRQCEQVVFAPGKEIPDAYNLWRGFAITPDFIDSEAKCARYLAHARENICQGDKGLYDYVLQWMANGVQNPGRPGGAALVLRGNMGTGKGEFARHYGSLFGANFIPVTKPEHITGKFNAHMGEAIVLFADEAFFAGNPQHEQILKVLVTEREWLIERKGLDAVRSRSCLHIILACNNDWSVPVSADDRRFCCIEVGNQRQRDHAYFAALNSQIEEGGREALLGFLLKVDLTGFHPENFPRTDEHDQQRARTRHGIDALIEELCHEGRMRCANGEHLDTAITSGEEHRRGFDYWINNTAHAELRRIGAKNVKAALIKDWGCKRWREPKGARRWGIQFPPLADLRKTFTDKHGKTDWASDIEDWEPADCSGFEAPDAIWTQGSTNRLDAVSTPSRPKA